MIEIDKGRSYLRLIEFANCKLLMEIKKMKIDILSWKI